MDYNTNPINTLGTSNDIDDIDAHNQQRIPRSKSGITPLAVILARNVQSFFANKVEKKEKNGTTTNTTSNATAMDVCAVLHDVDEILHHRSIEDGRLLLRGMVADLLREIDILRYKYDTLHSQFVTVKEERDVVNHDYNDRINALLMALQSAMTPSSSISSKAPGLETSSSSVANEWKEQIQSGKTLSADDATMLTIQTLTKKIESLHTMTIQQQEQILQLREQMEDLQCDNDAKVHKIMALEKQFTQINKKRTKMTTKFPSTVVASSSQLVLRPLRINENDDNYGARKNPTTTVFYPEEELGDKNAMKDDYDAIYQDNKENIIANIFMSKKGTKNKKDTETVETDTMNKNNKEDAVVENENDGNTDMVPNVVVIESDDVIQDIVEHTATTSEASTVLEPERRVPTTPLDMPDDEKEGKVSRENDDIVPTSPNLPLTQIGNNCSATNDSEDAAANAHVVTPPPSFTKTNSSKPKMVMILNDTTNHTNTNSSSMEISKAKKHHHPRVGRLVKLVEQV